MNEKYSFITELSPQQQLGNLIQYKEKHIHFKQCDIAKVLYVTSSNIRKKQNNIPTKRVGEEKMETFIRKGKQSRK